MVNAQRYLLVTAHKRMPSHGGVLLWPATRPWMPGGVFWHQHAPNDRVCVFVDCARGLTRRENPIMGAIAIGLARHKADTSHPTQYKPAALKLALAAAALSEMPGASASWPSGSRLAAEVAGGGGDGAARTDLEAGECRSGAESGDARTAAARNRQGSPAPRLVPLADEIWSDPEERCWRGWE